ESSGVRADKGGECKVLPPLGIVLDELITKSYPSNELAPAYEMDLSDNDWDPSAGLVLSDNEDVAADMELSDDDGA
ncbi:hypothetical protein DXG01_003583, partial [Tephrocybe rancida]